ncbi:MAG: RCC1 domain-containing protein, partial [Planctomycetota bacterium]|nr:RCC1 domain-containing protein [Planctomycetota bacterium]
MWNDRDFKNKKCHSERSEESGISLHGFLSLFIVTAIFYFVMGQTAFAGYIIGWGSMSVNSSDFVRNNFVAIAAGRTHSLALKSDGSIVGWGYNNYGQATPPSGNNYIAISVGG